MTDYGLNPVYDVPDSDKFAGGSAPAAIRWQAPELQEGLTVMEPKPADIYAFGILAWEVLNGKVAFEELPAGGARASILRGYRPDVPDGLVGDLIKECWAQGPESRPKIEEVVRRLKECVTV